jgi:hypothetical protein
MKLNSKYIPAAILIQSFFLLTTSFISKASAENCQYSVNKDNGKQYNVSGASQFCQNINTIQ